MRDVGLQGIGHALWPPGREVPTKIIHCRHCGQKNRVQVPSAVLKSLTWTCGRCGRALFLGVEEPLTGIESRAYEHDLDRKSLAALKAVPGFPAMVKWIIANLGERRVKIHQMSSSIRCSKDQFPELLALLDVARKRLDIQVNPDLYLSESPRMNAMVAGVEQPTIIVWSALLDQLDDQELLGTFAHELGHVHAGHVLYKTMARVVVEGTALLGGYAKLLTIPLRKALLVWDRCSELTADRASLLATRNLPAVLSSFLKFAGGHRPGVTRRTTLQMAPFVEQARELARIEATSWLDAVFATLLTMDQSHPYVVWRLMHLVEWVETGSYLEILAGQYTRK